MTNKELFREMLKSRRKAMGVANRKKTQNKVFKTAWLYPVAKEKKYAREITKLMKEVTGKVNSLILPELSRWITDYHGDGVDTFKRDSFSSDLRETIQYLQEELNKTFGVDAPKIRAFITGTGNDVSTFNLFQFQKYAKELLGVEFVVTEPWELEVIDSWSDTNYELIKSLSNEYVTKVNTLVSEGVQFGRSAAEIKESILKLSSSITGPRARLIARDQVGKLNGQLTKRRMTDVDINMYTWLTAGDERVRGNPTGPFKNAVPSHYVMAQGNKIYRWDDSLVYSTDGGTTWKNRSGKMTRAIPGEDIQCRCTAIPYVIELVKEIDKEIEEEKTA